MTTHWMTALAKHWKTQKQQHTHEKLAIVFDIDGTLVDCRYTLLYLLKAFDDWHYSHWFDDVEVQHIDCYEGHLEQQLIDWGIPASIIIEVKQFVHEERWQEYCLLESEVAYPQVFDIIHALNQCPQTQVALNTGRCNSLRELTIKSLNQLNTNSDFVFQSEYLKMNHFGWENVYQSKINAIKDLQAEGYRVIAMLDNEPSNLNAMTGLSEELLLLHIDTLYGKPEPLHPRCIQGKVYCKDNFFKGLEYA